MEQDFTLLSSGEKKVAAKILDKAGYSSRRIEELLGIDNVTAWRSAKEATPEELKQFETDFEVAISEMKRKGIGLVQKRLLELLPKEKRIDQLVKAGEYLEGKQTGIAVKVDNHVKQPSEMTEAELDEIMRGRY